MTDASNLAPDDFDLDAARHAYSSTPDDQRKRCPTCESPNISPLTGKWVAPEAAYRCDHCGDHFDYPTQ